MKIAALVGATNGKEVANMYICDRCGQLSAVVIEIGTPAGDVPRRTEEWKTVRLSVSRGEVWTHGIVCGPCCSAVESWMPRRLVVAPS